MTKGIILKVEGGSVSIISNPSKLSIMVRDYDTDGYDEEQYDLKTDKDGDQYTEIEAEKS